MYVQLATDPNTPATLTDERRRINHRFLDRNQRLRAVAASLKLFERLFRLTARSGSNRDISIGGAELAGLALEADLVDECLAIRVAS